MDVKSARIYFTSGTSFAPIIYEFGIYNSTATNALILSKNLTPTLEIAEPDLKPGLNKLYPNPVSQQLTYIYNALTDDRIDLQIYDILGRRIISQKINIVRGSNRGQIDVSTARGGIYFFKIGNDKIYIQKFIVNR